MPQITLNGFRSCSAKQTVKKGCLDYALNCVDNAPKWFDSALNCLDNALNCEDDGLHRSRLRFEQRHHDDVENYASDKSSSDKCGHAIPSTAPMTYSVRCRRAGREILGHSPFTYLCRDLQHFIERRTPMRLGWDSSYLRLCVYC